MTPVDVVKGASLVAVLLCFWWFWIERVMADLRHSRMRRWDWTIGFVAVFFGSVVHFEFAYGHAAGVISLVCLACEVLKVTRT